MAGLICMQTTRSSSYSIVELTGDVQRVNIETEPIQWMSISPKIGYTFSILMSEPHTPPIFSDPRHRRGRLFTRTVQSIAAVGACIVAVLLASGLIHPVLPSLGLPPLRALPPVHHLVPPQSKPIPTRSARRLQRARQRLAKHLAQARLKGTAPVPPASPGPAAFIG